MGYTVNFTDNQLISASELTDISRSIDEGSEAVDFKDNTLYGVDELNNISASLITKGVSSGLDVSLSGENVIISQGVAYFSDGRKITVDADGIILTKETNKHQYIWLLNDTVNGLVSAKCTESAPSGDFVMLAEIEASNVLVAKKDIALMKNSSLMPNYYECVGQHINILKTTEGTTFTLNVGKDFRRMVILSQRGPVYIDWNAGKIYRYKDPYMEEAQVYGTRIEIKSYLDIEFISYENNVLTYKAHCSTIHGSVYGDLVIDCM